MHLPFKKDPQATLDYLVDWSKWLDKEDEIVTSAFTVPSGLVKDDESHGARSATVWLSGGTSGQRYTVKNTIQTAAGRTDERSFVVEVKEK